MAYHSGVSAGGSSRMHNGNTYNNHYCGGDSRDADSPPQTHETEVPTPTPLSTSPSADIPSDRTVIVINLGDSHHGFRYPELSKLGLGGETTIKYAKADRETSSTWILRDPRVRNVNPLFHVTPRPTDHDITLEWRSFGFVLDPQTPVPDRIRRSLKAQRAQLKTSCKTAASVFSDYLSALHRYNSGHIRDKALNHSIDTILVVPSTWSDKAMTTASETAKDIGFDNITLVKASEASIQDEMINGMEWRLKVGDTLMTFEQEERVVYCGVEEIVSLEPFQLKWGRPPGVDEKPPSRLGFFLKRMFGTASRIHNGEARLSSIYGDFDVQWIEAEIGRASAQRRELGHEAIKFVCLYGLRDWICYARYKVEQRYPDMEIMVVHDNATVYQGAVIHALSRVSQEDADAATSGRPVEVSALHNIADIWN